MTTYNAQGIGAFQAYAAALSEEHSVAHELAQCAKIEHYHLLAGELFTRLNAARANSATAFKLLQTFQA
jgi:hypothetical protein